MYSAAMGFFDRHDGQRLFDPSSPAHAAPSVERVKAKRPDGSICEPRVRQVLHVLCHVPLAHAGAGVHPEWWAARDLGDGGR